MRSSALTLAALSLAACLTPEASNRYAMADLQALEAQGAWAELSEHLTDVPPSKRGDEWKKVAETCAVGVLADAPTEGDPLAHLALADQLVRRFPTLKGSAAFRAKRAEWGVKDLLACRWASGCRKSDSEWTMRIYRFAQTDPASIALPAAAMEQGALIPEVTVPLFELVLGDQPGSPLCKEATLQKAVLGALKGNNWNVEGARRIASKLCFEELKGALVAELDAAKDDGLLQTSCDFLTRSGALSPAQVARCAPHATYKEKNRTTSASFTLEPQH